jgi:hypothetical protein
MPFILSSPIITSRKQYRNANENPGIATGDRPSVIRRSGLGPPLTRHAAEKGDPRWTRARFRTLPLEVAEQPRYSP